MGVTNTPAESPTAGDENIDEIVDQTTAADPESSAGNDAARAPSAQPSGTDSDRSTEKRPESALDRLKKVLVAKPADEEPPEPEPSETTSEEPETTPVAKAPEKVPDEPADDDALKGFSDKEIKHPSNKGMVLRIRELADQRKTLKQTVKALEPIRHAGEFIRDFEAKNGFQPEETVAALELAAAFKAGRPEAVDALEQSAAQLRRDLGLPPPVVEQPAIEPYKGALPQEFQDMVSVLGFSEADVRLFAGFQAAQKTRATAPPPVQRPAPRPQQIPRQQAPPAPRVNTAALDAANENVLAYLEQQGIQPTAAPDHISKMLWPILQKLAPNGKPQDIPAEDRLRLVTIAQQRFKLDEAKKAAERKKNSPPPLTSSASSAASTSASKPKNDLDKLKARMVGRR